MRFCSRALSSSRHFCSRALSSSGRFCSRALSSSRRFCFRALSSSRGFCSRSLSSAWRSNPCSCLNWMNLSQASSCFARSSALFVAEETPELRYPADFELECFDSSIFTLECFEAETLDRTTGRSASKSAISSVATPCCSSQVRTR